MKRRELITLICGVVPSTAAFVAGSELVNYKREER
jgi:hypothetical protein